MDELRQVIYEHKEFFNTGLTKNIDYRLKQLKTLRQAIIENQQAITEALYNDLHKPAFESFATEIGYVLSSIDLFIRKLKSWAKIKKVKTPKIYLGSKSYIYPEPYGLVLIIGPYNYPFQLVIEPLIGAMAAGNCVIAKPSEYAPHTSKLISSIISNYFDKRYIRVIEGDKEVNSLLINSEFDYIFFTGSVTAGKKVMEAASKNLIPVTLELGGKSPCIVDKNTNIETAARRIAWGKFLNAGQTCVAPDYLVAHHKIKSELIKAIAGSINEFYGSNPKLSPDYGRIVNKRHFERLKNLINEEKIAYGGEYELESLYIAPTILDNVSWHDEIMQDEIFGPLLPVIEYDNLDEIIRIINSRPKPLSLYVFTEDKEVEAKVIENLSFGGGCVNDTVSHIVSPYLPFGGVGASGIGSYHGKSSFETFSYQKSILKRNTKFDPKFIYPPYSYKKLKLLKKILPLVNIF